METKYIIIKYPNVWDSFYVYRVESEDATVYCTKLVGRIDFLKSVIPLYIPNTRIFYKIDAPKAYTSNELYE